MDHFVRKNNPKMRKWTIIFSLTLAVLSGYSGVGRSSGFEKGLAAPVSTRRYQPGEVCAADEPDIHRVSNEEDSNLINLHVYTPPLGGFNFYATEQ